MRRVCLRAKGWAPYKRRIFEESECVTVYARGGGRCTIQTESFWAFAYDIIALPQGLFTRGEFCIAPSGLPH